jgi:DNA-binding XRE family transcriptional regulator
VGYLNQNGHLYLGEALGNLLGDFYANASTELVSIAITVLIIDALVQRRETEREKRDLILQMGSPDNAFAREAVRKLRVRGWLEDGSLQGADLRKADLRGANLLAADMMRALLYDAKLSRAVLMDANLHQAGLFHADMRTTDLRGANLAEADLSYTDLRGADLFEADLRKARLYSADLRGAKIWANLAGADLHWAKVTNEQLAEAESLEGAILPDDTEYAGELPPQEPYASEAQSPTSELRIARQRAQLSQKELAEWVGVSPSTVGRWEREGKVPDAKTRAKVAEVLDRDPWAGEP